jgi:F0F1-type ATP synthase membrane subunit b/b'
VSEGPSAAARETTAMTSLPSVDDLPVVERGYDETRVREAFDAFRRHVVQLQAQLRVLQAAGRTAQVDPTGHAVRMDALHLIREAAEFADVLERDAQRASAAQLQRTEQEVRQRQQEIQERETEIQRFREESERQRNEILTAARNEARQLVADANRDAAKELREAEARGARLLEQSRHQATELTNATRAEVEQMLEWARAQASTIIARAQQGTEQLLAAAGLGEARANEVADEIVKSAETQATSARAAAPDAAPEPEAQPLRAAPTPEAPEQEPPSAEPDAEQPPPSAPEGEDTRS